MNNDIWKINRNEGILSCILNDSLLSTNRAKKDSDDLSKEQIDQLILVGLKYKKKCKHLVRQLEITTNELEDLQKNNSVLDDKINNMTSILHEQEVTLNQHYINDINILKDEKNNEIERLKSELISEQSKSMIHKQKYESLDSIRKKEVYDREELIRLNTELVQELETKMKHSEAEKMNILMSRDQARDQASDSERSSLLRRALIAEQKMEELLKDGGNSEETDRLIIELSNAQQRIEDLERIVKLAREELLNMNDKMVSLMACKEHIENSTKLVIEENKKLSRLKK